MLKQNSKILCLFLYFLIAPLCFCGVIVNMGMSAHYDIKFKEEMLPIYDCKKIFSDNKQNLYLENGEFCVIQVYDKEGIFKYRIDVPADSGGFDFYIDNEDFLHIRTYRNEKEFLIKDEMLLESKNANNEEFSEKIEYFSKTKGQEFKLNWKKNVLIYDEQNFLKEISLEKVYFPLSHIHYVSVIGLGLLVLFILHKNEIMLLYKKQSERGV